MSGQLSTLIISTRTEHFLTAFMYNDVITVCHETLVRPNACLSDNNEVWSDRLSDQRIRREPKGLRCIRMFGGL